MSSNFKTIEPLNWKGLVTEAKKRRKQEKLKQKEHALLAGVSVPTMYDFDQGSTTLTLQKIIDILNVVGLVSNDDDINNLERFYDAAESRWFEKVKLKPKECSSEEFWDIVFRHTFGSLTYTFELLSEETLKINPKKMIETMSSIPTLRYGWGELPFNIYNNYPSLKPSIIDLSIIEHHFRREQIESNDTHDTSFWRASPSGLFHFHRGYVEDNLKNGTLQQGRYIYRGEPIYSAIQMIDYASKIAQKLTQDSSAKIALKVTYKGLNGRQLRFEENSFETYKSKLDWYSTKIEFIAKTINETTEGKEHLANLVLELLGNLFLQFDFYKIDKEYIHFIIKQVYEKNHIEIN